MSAIPIEVKLFVIMFVLLGGILWLMKVWGDFVTRREARTMSSTPAVRSSPLRSTVQRFSAFHAGTAKEINSETVRSVEEIERDKIEFAETAVADALARLILADELDKTKAIKIGAGKKSGEAYQKWARLVAASIDRQKQPQFLDENGGRVPASYPVSGRR